VRDDGDLVAAWLAGLPAGLRDGVDDTRALADALAAACTRARAAWPEIAIEPATFVHHLAGKLRPDAPAWTELLVEDLYLACAAAAGDPAAIRALERDVFRGIAGVLASRGLGRASVDDVAQNLRTHLLVGEGGRPGRIADYGGRGPLRSWIVVAAVRMGNRADANAHRDAALALVSVADARRPDAEQQIDAHAYQPQIEQACEQALVGLPARERALLRMQLVDGASIDQIGRIYGVHRATAARWLARARSLVLADTTDRLAVLLGVAPCTAAEIAALAQGRLDISVARLLQTQPT
jgi:RNA polymerase sigma-70 factor (ECF subfamily)